MSIEQTLAHVGQVLPLLATSVEQWGFAEGVINGLKQIEVTFTYGVVPPYKIRRGIMRFIDTQQSPGHGRIEMTHVWEDLGDGTYAPAHLEPICFSTNNCQLQIQGTTLVGTCRVDPAWMLTIHIGGDRFDRSKIRPMEKLRRKHG